MNRFLKNSILTMLIICFVLNIVNLIGQVIQHHAILPEITKVAEQVKEIGISGEEAYYLLASFFRLGDGYKILIQATILIISISLGIIIGLIITFEEKSKLKVILKYVVGLIITVLIPTIYNSIYYMTWTYFIEDIFYYLEIIWKFYTILFFLIYALKIYISKVNARKLNNILKEKIKK